MLLFFFGGLEDPKAGFAPTLGEKQAYEIVRRYREKGDDFAFEDRHRVEVHVQQVASTGEYTLVWDWREYGPGNQLPKEPSMRYEEVRSRRGQLVSRSDDVQDHAVAYRNSLAMTVFAPLEADATKWAVELKPEVETVPWKYSFADVTPEESKKEPWMLVQLESNELANGFKVQGKVRVHRRSGLWIDGNLTFQQAFLLGDENHAPMTATWTIKNLGSDGAAGAKK